MLTVMLLVSRLVWDMGREASLMACCCCGLLVFIENMYEKLKLVPRVYNMRQICLYSCDLFRIITKFVTYPFQILTGLV